MTGYTTGMLMIWFMNAFDYPILVGGKPMFSPFAAFPPSYELTILFGAFGALFGMLFLNRLPRLHHPLLKHKRFALRDARQVLPGDRDGRSEVSARPKPASCSSPPAASASRWWRTECATSSSVFALLGAGRGHRGRHPRRHRSRRPPIEVFPDMDRQPKLRPQQPNDFFADRLSSQLHAADTVARSRPIRSATSEVHPFEDHPLNTGRCSRARPTSSSCSPLPVTGAAAGPRAGALSRSTACRATAPPGDGKGIDHEVRHGR